MKRFKFIFCLILLLSIISLINLVKIETDKNKNLKLEKNLPIEESIDDLNLTDEDLLDLEEEDEEEEDDDDDEFEHIDTEDEEIEADNEEADDFSILSKTFNQEDLNKNLNQGNKNKLN
jgi:hypothetical protein